MLYRGQRRTEGLRELYKKVVCSDGGLEEQWISVDEFYREFNNLPFTVEADIFIPGGGRPETIDIENWQKFSLQKANLQPAQSLKVPILLSLRLPVLNCRRRALSLCVTPLLTNVALSLLRTKSSLTWL